ncbi:hypothetical protein BN903_45 [Halorubrum sp. AJ67]|nr:hypothetical protein BN903_45 [Halorubrum sp. AJ67]
MVHLGVAMLDFSRDEPGAKDTSITDHLSVGSCCPGKS